MKPVASHRTCESRLAERGAVIVEFAIVLTILILLLGGGVEFGLLARDHQVLQNAAREGARFSALPANNISGAGSGAGAAAIEGRIKSHMQTYLQNEGITTIPDSSIVVNQNYMLQITLASGVSIDVRSSEIIVTYPKSLILPGMNLLPDPINLSGRALFRNFY